MSPRTVRVAKAALIGLVAVLPFLRAWDYGLINLDDYAYLSCHPQLWQGPFLTSVRHFATTVQDAIWMPLTWLSYALDYAVFGDWYGGFHLHAIALHGVNAALVYCLLRMIFADSEKREWACIAGAVLWALHPLRCESVILLSSRKDLLSFFWELLALICWIRGSRRDGRDELRLSSWAMVFFALGACCKPSVMTFPALCLILDAFVVRKIVIRRYAVPFAFSIFLGVFASWQQHVGGAMTNGADETFLMRLADSVAAFGIYLKNTVWPQGLILQCTKRWPELPRFLLPAIVICLAYGGYLLAKLNWYRLNFGNCVRVSRQGKWPDLVESAAPRDYALAGMLWFAVAIFPMLGLVSFGYHAFADRFTYIPSFGLSIVLAGTLVRMGQVVRPVAAVGLALGLGMLTWRQVGFWRNDCAIFSHTLEADGDDNWFAHRSLGGWYFEFPHDLENCVRHYGRAFECAPEQFGNNYIIYICALCELGRTDEIGNLLNAYWESITKGHSQEEIACMVRDEAGREANEVYNRYLMCKTAWWMTDPATVDLAEGYLHKMESRCSTDKGYSYLRWQLAKRTGNREEESKYFAELTKPNRADGYFSFRYLRNKAAR